MSRHQLADVIIRVHSFETNEHIQDIYYGVIFAVGTPNVWGTIDKLGYPGFVAMNF